MQFHAAPILAQPATAMWIALRFAREPVTVSDIILSSAQPLSDGLRLLDRWRAAGLIARVGYRPETYTMSQDARRLRTPPATAATEPPLKPLRKLGARARMWIAIRILRQFDAQMLCIAADVTLAAARPWLGVLVRAGYLVRSADRHGDASYRLARDPGPQHPRIHFREGQLIDWTGSPAAPASASVFFEGSR